MLDMLLGLDFDDHHNFRTSGQAAGYYRRMTLISAHFGDFAVY